MYAVYLVRREDNWLEFLDVEARYDNVCHSLSQSRVSQVTLDYFVKVFPVVLWSSYESPHGLSPTTHPSAYFRSLSDYYDSE